MPQALMLLNLKDVASSALPAVQQIALTHLAGFCQFAHQHHVSRQQHGEGSRDARRRGIGKDGTLVDTSKQGLSKAGSSKGSSGSSEKGPGGDAGTAAAERSLSGGLVSGFAELLLANDHELTTVPGGKAAVAAHAAMVEENSNGSASSAALGSGAWCSENAVPVLLAGMRALAAGKQCMPHGVMCPTHSSNGRSSEAAASSSSSSPSGAGSISNSSCRSSSSPQPLMCRASSLQLVLEAVALYGSMGAFAELDKSFQLIYLVACNTVTGKVSGGPAELDAFVAARGHLLLRVLLLLSSRGVDGQRMEWESLANLLKAASVEQMPLFMTMMTYRSTDDSGGHATCCWSAAGVSVFILGAGTPHPLSALHDGRVR